MGGGGSTDRLGTAGVLSGAALAPDRRIPPGHVLELSPSGTCGRSSGHRGQVPFKVGLSIISNWYYFCQGIEPSPVNGGRVTAPNQERHGFCVPQDQSIRT